MDFVNGIYSLDKSRFAIPYGEKLQRFDKLAKYMNIAVKGLGDNTVAAMTVVKALYVIRAGVICERVQAVRQGGTRLCRARGRDLETHRRGK